jgi:hypothetical protein
MLFCKGKMKTFYAMLILVHWLVASLGRRHRITAYLGYLWATR